jgi:hypothetical protein
MPEVQLRLEGKIDAVKKAILNRVFRLILGTLVVNIIASGGGMVAVARLVAYQSRQ